MAFPAPPAGPAQVSAPHCRTPKSAPRRAPPCHTHIVEGITKPLLLQLVERRVEEAEGCQPPLQAPVIDQCHHACHHRCGRLRGHNPSAPGPPCCGQQGTDELFTEVPETQGSGMRFVTTQ